MIKQIPNGFLLSFHNIDAGCQRNVALNYEKNVSFFVVPGLPLCVTALAFAWPFTVLFLGKGGPGFAPRNTNKVPGPNLSFLAVLIRYKKKI